MSWRLKNISMLAFLFSFLIVYQFFQSWCYENWNLPLTILFSAKIKFYWYSNFQEATHLMWSSGQQLPIFWCIQLLGIIILYNNIHINHVWYCLFNHQMYHWFSSERFKITGKLSTSASSSFPIYFIGDRISCFLLFKISTKEMLIFH